MKLQDEIMNFQLDIWFDDYFIIGSKRGLQVGLKIKKMTSWSTNLLNQGGSIP